LKTHGFKKVVPYWNGINIFEKKLLFIPINGDHHWSLCVIVNPGAVLKEEYSAKKTDDPIPCLIFLNSMQATAGNSEGWVAQNICNWLNGVWAAMRKTRESQNEEWKDRIDKWKKRKPKGNPFHESSMLLFSPKGTHL
jgi:Ulp1 family protease